MKIAIGITTTTERSDVFYQSGKAWLKFRPECATIYSHCDTEREGVSVAKNKVLAKCADADFIFIVDDDCYPIKDGWWLPYIESGLNHACWNFNRTLTKITCKASTENGNVDMVSYFEFDKPNGCMLFFTKKCIEVCGGWDVDFKGYGYEHVSLSDRIFNNGLTPARYIDVPDSKGLFELANCESSFTYSDRAQIPNNLHLYQQKYYSKEFKPFK